MANVKRPYTRSYSLGSVFKRKRETPYQPWEEDALLETASAGGAEESPSYRGTSPAGRTHGQDIGQAVHDVDDVDADDSVWRTEGTSSPSAIAPGSSHLVDCFYLGAYDMTGQAIRGRGCIDDPAAQIWMLTQEKRRKNSLPSSFRLGASSTEPSSEAITFKRKFVRLFASKDDLQVFDDITNELIGDFAYRKISFVGTHPKYKQLFAFIAEDKGKRTPFLHAFKCEDKASASDTANKLSTVFERKIAELLAESDRFQAESKPQTIQVDVDATLLN